MPHESQNCGNATQRCNKNNYKSRTGKTKVNILMQQAKKNFEKNI